MAVFRPLLLASFAPLIAVANLNPCAAEMPAPAVAPFDGERARRFQQQWAEYLGRPVVWTNSIGMKMVLIPPGEFLMGSTRQEYDRLMEAARGKPWRRWFQRFARTELPAHRVTISRPFYLGATEVTVGQFRRFVEETGYNASGQMLLRWSDKEARFVTQTGSDAAGQALKSDRPKRRGLAGYGFENGRWVRKVGYDWQNVGYPMSDDHPVLNVSWHDAVAFCKWLTEREGEAPAEPQSERSSSAQQELRPPKRIYRLPTEAEWEYACRAGTDTRWFFGDHTAHERLFDYAWAEGNSGNRPHPVGRKKPNPFGLYDIYGNLWEWCQDWSDVEWPDKNKPGTYYAVSPKVDPRGPETGRGKVVRGGSFDFGARSAFRVWGGGPDNRREHIGFRVAMTISPNED